MVREYGWTIKVDVSIWNDSDDSQPYRLRCDIHYVVRCKVEDGYCILAVTANHIF